MIDEMQRLRNSRELFRLLLHYAQLGKEDRETWQDRLRDFEGLAGKELARLYGELLAHGWLEQNTGLTPVLVPGRLAACYRITPAGVKVLRQAEREEDRAVA